MKKKIVIKVWQLLIIVVILLIAFLVICVFITEKEKDKTPHEIASINSGLNIMDNAPLLYSRDWYNFIPPESGYDFVFKIPNNETKGFITQLSENNFTAFSDTSIVIQVCMLGHKDTLENGYMKYYSIKEHYYYDLDTRLFYYHLVDY